jgi:hypothetical protein
MTRNIKHSQDPVWKSDLFKENNFYTAWGAHTHFKRQIILLTNRLSTQGPKTETSGIPEVILEPHLEFYKEVETFWNGFKSRISEYINSCEQMLKINYREVKSELEVPMQNMSEAIALIIKSIKLQETGQMTPESKENLRNLIHYDDASKWTGWYTDLFNNESKPEEIFNYDVWISNSGIFSAAKNLDFEGASLFNVVKFTNLGVIMTEDSYEKTKKMMIFAKYNVKDLYAPLDSKPDVEQMTKDIIDRE